MGEHSLICYRQCYRKDFWDEEEENIAAEIKMTKVSLTAFAKEGISKYDDRTERRQYVLTCV
jgi:hypothetical protein